MFPPKARLFFYVCAAVFLLSSYFLLLAIDQRFGVDAPVAGGSMTEGVVGTLRFINPVLAFSEPDKDLTALVYSGLLRATENGYEPDLAEKYTVSEDGKVYTITLAEDRHFHDQTLVTVKDVLFTLNLIKDDRTKSPLGPSWAGISVESTDERTIVLTLDRPYAPVLENLTVGILPEHIWKSVRPEEMLFSSRNLEAIGSGPYEVRSVTRNDSGIPQEVTLRSFNAGNKKPYISKLSIRIFASEDDVLNAFVRHNIDATARISPLRAKELSDKGFEIHSIQLPRIFAAFFNPKHNAALAHLEVRQALDQAIDRNTIIDNVLGGFGTPLAGPFSTSTDQKTGPEIAKNTLLKAGWQLGTDGIFEKTVGGKKESLVFELHTSNAPELVATAELLKNMWRAAGIAVTPKFFETGDLNQQSIRARNYDMLLFGEYQGRFPDPYAFWHSSQRDDPGLNVAMYSSKEADTLLEKIRLDIDHEIRERDYTSLDTLIKTDIPAVFLYSPNLVYAFNQPVLGKILTPGTAPDRFLSVQDWYVRTDRIWSIFTSND